MIKFWYYKRPDKMIDARHLLQFLAIVEHNSFTKAAEALNLTQPALTRNIKLMETRLQAALLLRGNGNRKIQPTLLGMQVLEQARQVERSCRRVLSAVESYHAGYEGEIRVGCAPTAALYLLPSALSAFSAQHSKVRLDVESGSTSLLEQKLERGDIDVRLGPPPTLPGGIQFTEFFRYRMAVVAGKKHPLAKKKIFIKAATLERQKWIMYRQGTALRRKANNYLHALGVLSPAQAFDLPSNMIVTLLEQGKHLSVVPEFIFREKENAAKIVALQVEQTDTGHLYGSSILSDKTYDPALKNFIDFVRGQLAGQQ